MSEAPFSEQAATPEALLAEVTAAAQQTLDTWAEQTTPVAQSDGSPAVSLGGVNRFSSLAYKYLRRFDRPDGAPREYEYADVSHGDLRTERVLRWAEGGDTVSRGVKNRLWDEDAPQVIEELPVTAELAEELRRKVAGVDSMLANEQIEATRARNRPERQVGALERMLGWIGMR